MSLAAFRRIQVGKETTSGTLVPATKRLVGVLTMTPEQVWHRPVEERNSLSEFFRSVVAAQRTALRFEGDASYDQLINLLAMAVKGGVTGVQQGGTAAYLWTYTPNYTSKNAPNTYTFEYGDDDQEFECGYVFVSDLELAVAFNEVVTLRAAMEGRGTAKSTFTGSLTDPTNFQQIVANNAKFYRDVSWATLGTTQKAAVLAGATIKLTTGFIPVKYADGSLDFSALSEKRRHLALDLDLIMGADAEAAYDDYVAGTLVALRLEFIGPLIEGAYFYKLTIDAVGKYTSAPEIFGEREGENLLRLTFQSHQDTSGNEFSIAVINKETAL